MEVAGGLGVEQTPERERLAGDGQVDADLVDDLDEDAAIGAALVELAGGVEKAGAEAERRRDAVAVAQLQPRGLESGRVRRGAGQVGLDREIVALVDAGEEGGEVVVGLQRGRVGLEEASRGVLRLFDVGLVEGVDAEDLAGDGGGELPAEELGAQPVCAGEGDDDGGLGSVLDAERDEEAVGAVDGGRADGLALDGDDADALFAGRLGDQLFEPGAEGGDLGREEGR